MIVVWTEENVDQLRAMWPSHSARDIAAVLGVSRDAVLGKAYRLGLDSKLKPFVPKCFKRPAPKSVTIISTISRMPIATRRINRDQDELSKPAMRAMLQQAVVNTGGRVA